jgi:two-component sensor histidine kinase
MSSEFTTLVVEDNEADAFFVKKLLDDASRASPRLGRFSAESTRTLETALQRLSTGAFDAILLDLGLPDSQGLDTLRAVRNAARAASIVVLTGSTELELGLEALGLGAQDFLPKDELGPSLITRTLRYAIERRRAEAQLLATIREKEVLLKELNHRAKNNLQVVTALLSMQARRSDDDRFRSLVQAARGRVEAMARAHEQLHSSSDLARIDFSAYLKNLSTFIYSSHGGESRGIVLEVDVEKHELPLDRAVTAGLVVNELLTNAFKHAFTGEQRGRIWLRLRAREQHLELTLEDNGRGLENQVGAPNALGLGLVATLAEQLDAALECDDGPGTRLRLTFPRGESA